ncbi:MAG: arylsulfatase [Planctomycetes bacterium]|nr:arylsulfatase [Planctomycetota bacterium]
MRIGVQLSNLIYSVYSQITKLGYPLLRLGFLFFLTGLIILPKTTAQPPRPNIIVILCDDVGYSDLGCYGSEIRTPNIDSLAKEGLRFTQFYNTGRCCPTRASLLTGLYPHQAGIGHMMGNDNLLGYKGDLNRECATIAEVLKTAGYKNYISGKWHVTPVPKGEDMINASKHNWPLQRGFDRFYGTIHGAGSLWDPNSLTRDNDFISPYADPQYKPERFYYTDAISDQACRFIKEHNSDKPFFMYVAYTAAHWPMHAPEEDIDSYNGVYDEGFETIRKARYKRMLELGVIDKKAKLSPQVKDWSKVKNKKWDIRNMQTYAAMISVMDKGIGRIVDNLKNNKLYDNTLILFMQDNGGCQEGLGRTVNNKKKNMIGGARASKPQLAPMKPEELQTEMIPAQSRDGYKTRGGPEAMPGPADTYIAYGEGWANVCNTPFRMYKHFVHEGGISTSLVAHWPQGIKAKNEFRHTPSHLVDIMATAVDLSGAQYPITIAGTAIQPMEGKSLSTVFRDDTMDNRHILFEHEGNGAIRRGNWKLVGKKVMGPEKSILDKWELYNIAEDRSELNNLIKKQPDLAKEMVALFEAEGKRVRFFPSKYGRAKKVKKAKKK